MAHKPLIDTSNLNEHAFPLLRRDFVTVAECAFCPRDLPTGIALILRHPVYGEVPAGPSCGKKWGIVPKQGFQDYTKLGLKKNPKKPSSPNGKPETELTPDNGEKNRDSEYLSAVEYVMLRAEKLPAQGFVGLERDMISWMYRALLKSGSLTVGETRAVINFMNAPAVQSSKFGYRSLMLAYTHSYWLNRCIEVGEGKLHPNNYERLISFRTQLFEKWSLSPKQIACLNRDLLFVFGEKVAPELDPNGFSAFRPDNKQRHAGLPTPKPGQRSL